MRIPEHIVDQIRLTMNIVEVVSDYVQLKKKGTNWWGLSPFKSERTPSFSVHEAKGIYKDFSSGKGGTAIGFLMEVEGYTYTEALLHLARKYNIEVAMEEGDVALADDRASLFALNNFAAAWYHTQLTETDEGKQLALSYIKERGFTEKLITQWQLGYSPQGWDAFTTHALKQQYQERFLLDTGLSLRSEKTQKLMDRFHGRVMFPILDVAGKVVGFGARILGSDAKAAKYLNSPDSSVYNKSQVLYGLYYARQSIRNQGKALIVEGYTDVLALHQAGIDTAVASCGTSLVAEQIRLLGRYAKELVILYDGDTAGIQATQRAIPLILAQGLTPKVLQLPDGHDPDSYLKMYGPSAFEDYAAQQTQDFLAYLIATWVPPNADAATKSRAATELAQVVAAIPDDLARELHLQELSTRLGLEVDLLRGVVHKTQKQESARQHRMQVATEVAQPVVPQATVQNAQEVYEYELLRLLLNYPDKMVTYEAQTTTLFELIAEYISERTFANPVHEAVRQHFLIYYPQRQELTVQVMQDELPHPQAYLVNQLLSEKFQLSERWFVINRNTPHNDQQLDYVVEQTLLYYRRAHFLQMKQDLLQQIKACQDEPEQEEELIKLLRKSQKVDYLLRDITEKLKNVVI